MKSARNLSYFLITLCTVVLVAPLPVFAQENSYVSLADSLKTYSLKAALFGGIILIICSLATLTAHKISPSSKKILFIVITTIAMTVTLFLAASSFYLNSLSDYKECIRFEDENEHSCYNKPSQGEIRIGEEQSQ